MYVCHIFVDNVHNTAAAFVSFFEHLFKPNYRHSQYFFIIIPVLTEYANTVRACCIVYNKFILQCRLNRFFNLTLVRVPPFFRIAILQVHISRSLFQSTVLLYDLFRPSGSVLYTFKATKKSNLISTTLN